MTGLIGEYDCKVDVKGRFMFPADLRKQFDAAFEKGFVITHVNEEPVNTVEEFYEALKKANSSSVKISGVYPGYFGNYAFILNLNE
jgi:MraZ protein